MNSTYPLKTKTDRIVSSSLGKSTGYWFSKSNKYVVIQPPANAIIEMLEKGAEHAKVVDYCCEKLNFDWETAVEIVQEINQLIEGNSGDSYLEHIENDADTPDDTPLAFSKKYYRISNKVFFAEFESEEAESLCHPKLAHLEIPHVYQLDHHFRVSHSSDGFFSLFVDETFIGAWDNKNGHYLGGKFSMLVLQKIYGNEEKDWLGVFHAAGITDGKNSIMFFGDSGNGKSTLSALLLANGFDVLSDDFLPVESRSGLVCRFPAAISIKKQVYDIVATHFPYLPDLEEYEVPVLNKTYRYLPVDKTDLLKVPCRALIFVKYKKDAGFSFSKMESAEAFQELIPDSWISPEPDNVINFFKWFKNLPTYRLTYSDNTRMVTKINQIFNDELS